MTESILNVVLKHARANGVKKVVAIHLEIGELSDLENEWIQRYFDYLSKNTLAEGAKLKIKRTPVVMECRSCETRFKVNIKDMFEIKCPKCGSSDCTMVSGKEYYIKSMEAV